MAKLIVRNTLWIAAMGALLFVPAAVISMKMRAPDDPKPVVAAGAVGTTAADPLVEFNRIYHLDPDQAVTFHTTGVAQHE